MILDILLLLSECFLFASFFLMIGCVIALLVSDIKYYLGD